MNAQKALSKTVNPGVVYRKSSAQFPSPKNVQRMKSGQLAIEHAKTPVKIPIFLKFAAHLLAEKRCAHVRKALQEIQAENASRNLYEN